MTDTFFIGFMVALVLCLGFFILNNNTKAIHEIVEGEHESSVIRFKVRFNWRVYNDCWKFHILPCLRLKHKTFSDGDVKSRFDITVGWLFAFIRFEFEKQREKSESQD